MGHLGRSELKGENGDVVFLPKGLGGLRDGFGRLSGDGGRAIEAEEIALRIAGFDDAIANECEPSRGRQLERGLRIVCLGGKTQGQAILEWKFFAIQVWSQMAGVCSCELAGGIDANDEAGGEAPLLRDNIRTFMACRISPGLWV